MLDLHRLMLLREVKTRGSMSAAARELSYSHSSISQQLALLERETGVVLLEKVGRNVKLTAAGEELVRNTEAILAAVERAESDLATSDDRPRGVVTVAAFATISRSIVPAALSRLRSRYPKLDVHLRLVEPDAAVLQLISRQVDAVITDDYPGTQRPPASIVHASVLGEDPVRAYLPPPLCDADPSSLGDISWVMESPSSGSAQWALRVCREQGFEPVIAHWSSDLLFHLRMVEQGLAAAFLPDMVLRETASTLRPCAWLPADQHRTISFLVRTGSETRPALLAVREAITESWNHDL